MSVMHRFNGLESPAERAIRLSVDAATRGTTVDPLFRRRLRGRVLNSYVAAREGVARPSTRGRSMGTIGRASLYASIAMMLSVGGVMAGAGAAMPGDLLYPVKRQLEEVREAVLPAHFRDELAAAAFAQRVHELSRLIDAGEMARANALLPDVRASFEALAALRPATDDDSTLSRQLSVLAGLLERLPEPAANALERALQQAPGLILGNPPAEGGPLAPPVTGGPDREPRAAPERSGPEEPAPGVSGAGAGRQEESPAPRGREPEAPGRPNAPSSSKPEPGDGVESEGESD
jgi:hypothetical protein